MKILFVETGLPELSGQVGGSYYSLLAAVEWFSDSSLELHALFYEDSAIAHRFESAGCKVRYERRSGRFKRKLLAAAETKVLARKEESQARKSYRPKVGMSLVHYIFRSIMLFARESVFIVRLMPQIFRAYKVISAGGFDIVHCNNRFSACVEVVIASKLAGVPCIVHQRDYDHSLRAFSRLWIGVPVAFIAISTSIQESLEALGISLKKIVKLHNFIVDSSSPVNLNSRLDDHRISPVIRLVWVGRFVGWKGVDLCVEIAKEFRHAGVEFEFDIYGGGEGEVFERFVQQLSDAGLNANFRLLGYRASSEIYSQPYDFLVHTSRRAEPFGRVLIEAMDAGIIPVATRDGGPSDIIIHGVSGLLYDPQDVGEVVHSMIDLWADAANKLEMIDQGKRRVEDFFSPSAVMPKLLALYDAVVRL